MSDWEYENYRLRQIIQQQDEVLTRIRKYAEGLRGTDTSYSEQNVAGDLFSILEDY